MKAKKTFRRVEEKVVEDSIFLIIHHDYPAYFVHGAYSTERKLFAELKRLSEEPQNKLTREQKRHNKFCNEHPYCGRVPFADPMDAYQIREIQVQ